MGTVDVEQELFSSTPSIGDWTKVLSGAVAAGVLCPLAILFAGDIAGFHPFPQRTDAATGTVRIVLPPSYPAPGFSIGPLTR